MRFYIQTKFSTSADEGYLAGIPCSLDTMQWKPMYLLIALVHCKYLSRKTNLVLDNIFIVRHSGCVYICSVVIINWRFFLPYVGLPLQSFSTISHSFDLDKGYYSALLYTTNEDFHSRYIRLFWCAALILQVLMCEGVSVQFRGVAGV